MSLPSYWSRQIRIDNQSNINSWVEKKMKLLKKKSSSTMFDIGAGLKRYQPLARKYNWTYLSHDFNLYESGSFNYGLQHDKWFPLKHDFECDILEIPEFVKYGLIICTEVLEHVPDPISVLNKIRKLVAQDGDVLITVPMLSLIHQAPYYFTSGLSPFWFEYWTEKFGFEIVEGVLSGDFLDIYNQFLTLVRNYLPENSQLRNLIANQDNDLTKQLTSSLAINLLESGGFGVFVHLRVRQQVN